jgi:hypothetical protein
MTLYNQTQENYYVDRGLTPLPYPHLTGMKLQRDIVLGDFVFNSIDENGVVWVITDIDGWWNPPSAEMPNIERGYGDGSYDAQGRYRARDLNLIGSFLTSDPALVEAARDKLIEVADLVYKGAWLKTGTGPIRASFVRLSSSVDIETTTPRGRTDFNISLRAVDPIKYDWNDSDPDGYTVVEIPAKNLKTGESGIQTIVNEGNYTVPVYIEVIGPISSPATIFNKTTEELILIVSSIRGRAGTIIDNKELTLVESSLKDIATLTTRTAHNFQPGDEVLVEGVDEIFDGIYIISSTPSATTFRYEIENVSETFNVVSKKLFNNVATIEISQAHPFEVNNLVFFSGIDSVFNGTYQITSKTINTVSFSKTRVLEKIISGQSIISNKANIVTTDPHNFTVGERVTISGLNLNYNGNFIITSTPSTTSFTYSVTRTNAKAISNRALNSNIATITLTEPHGFIANENVVISGVSESFDGVYTITSTPTNETFTFEKVRDTSKTVLVKSRVSNVATLTTSTAHGISQGEQVVITNVDGFNGTFTVTAVPSSNSFSYANSGSTLSATSVQNGLVRVSKRKITKRERVAGVATITTATSHGLLVGETINVEGINASYNFNNRTVLSTPTSTTFTYTAAAGNEAAVDSAGLVTITGNIPSLVEGTTPSGSATVSGSLPFTSLTGQALIPNYIGVPNNIDNPTSVEPIDSSGFATKKNEVPFTPGVSINPESPATVTYGPELLEIDTLNREVFLNGEIEGARAKIDILADFIKLSPEENIIEFEDSGNPNSDALLKIYYRSGWLG